MCAGPPWRVSSTPLVEWRWKLNSCLPLFGTGFSGKGNWNGEVIVLEELEVVEAVVDNWRFGAEVYGVEVLRLDKFFHISWEIRDFRRCEVGC